MELLTLFIPYHTHYCWGCGPNRKSQGAGREVHHLVWLFLGRRYWDQPGVPGPSSPLSVPFPFLWAVALRCGAEGQQCRVRDNCSRENYKKGERKVVAQSQARLSHSEPKPQQNRVSGGRAREGCAEPNHWSGPRRQHAASFWGVCLPSLFVLYRLGWGGETIKPPQLSWPYCLCLETIPGTVFEKHFFFCSQW